MQISQRRPPIQPWSICLVIVFLFSAYGFAQTTGAKASFFAPEIRWRFDRRTLTAEELKLLETAAAPDLRAIQDQCGGASLNFADLGIVGVGLGSAGRGAILRLHGSCMCGGTGNCPLLVYRREKDAFRKVLDDLQGWAFAVVKQGPAVPDLVFVSNRGGSSCELTRYRYKHTRFEELDSDSLPCGELKQEP